MGDVRFRSTLKLAVCPGGLRIGASRLVFPYVFVPWPDIRVERRKNFLHAAELVFGAPAVGRLKIEGFIADRLARSTPAGQWPESGPFFIPDIASAFFPTALEWLAATIFLSLFFSLAPRLAEGFNSPNLPSLWITILFPAVIVGIFCIKRFRARAGK
jgi:hypothetical protein